MDINRWTKIAETCAGAVVWAAFIGFCLWLGFGG